MTLETTTPAVDDGMQLDGQPEGLWECRHCHVLVIPDYEARDGGAWVEWKPSLVHPDVPRCTLGHSADFRADRIA